MASPTRRSKRTQILRRQFNDSFCAPDGSFSVAKTIAVFGQIRLLYHLNMHFVDIMRNWDSLLVIVSAVILPDAFKKLITMKYGGTDK